MPYPFEHLNSIQNRFIVHSKLCFFLIDFISCSIYMLTLEIDSGIFITLYYVL